jgi:hypothetical protein
MAAHMRPFEVWVAGFEHHPPTTVYAETAGKAKYEHWLNVRDCMSDLPITAMRSRSTRTPPAASEDFLRCAKYRGWPEARPGVTRVRTKEGGWTGTIVGHNDSANFDVIFDDGPLAGRRCNVHPGELEAMS